MCYDAVTTLKRMDGFLLANGSGLKRKTCTVTAVLLNGAVGFNNNNGGRLRDERSGRASQCRTVRTWSTQLPASSLGAPVASYLLHSLVVCASFVVSRPGKDGRS